MPRSVGKIRKASVNDLNYTPIRKLPLTLRFDRQSSAPPPIPQRSPKSNVLLPSSLPLAEEFNPNAAKDSNNDDNYTPQKRAKSTTFGKEANFIQVECTKGGIEQVQRNQATAIICKMDDFLIFKHAFSFKCWE